MRYLLILPPLLFLGVFYFYPLASILSLGFFPDGGWEIGRLRQLISSKYYLEVLWFTTWQAGLSTLSTLVLALPGAYLFSHFEFRGKQILQTLTTVPFVLPTVVTAAAFKALLGNGGLINRTLMHLFEWSAPPIRIDHTVWFFIMAHVFYNYTVVLRILGGFWSRLPLDLTESANVLGASPVKTFFRITLPLLLPAIWASTLLVFIFCFTSFGVVLILGGPRLSTVEVEIYRQAVHLFNLPMAAGLSLVQILFTFCLMALYTRLEKSTAVSFMPEMSGRSVRRPQTRGQGFWVGLGNTSILILLGGPVLALLIGSVMTENGLSLAYYRSLFHHETRSILYIAPFEAILNSVGFAVLATVTALILGWFSAAYLVRSKGRGNGWWDPIFMLPLSTSAVTLGFGFIIALDEPPLNLRTSMWLPVAAHAMVAFPFVVRSLLPAWRSIPRCLREAATMLGGSPLRVWLAVDWPILARALAVGAVFAFAVSMGEFGATSFVARPRTATMPLAIYRFLSHPGTLNYGKAMAMSCLLMLTTAAGFIILERIRSASREQ